MPKQVVGIPSINEKSLCLHNLRMEIWFSSGGSKIFQLPMFSLNPEPYTSLQDIWSDLITLGNTSEDTAQRLGFYSSCSLYASLINDVPHLNIYPLNASNSIDVDLSSCSAAIYDTVTKIQ